MQSKRSRFGKRERATVEGDAVAPTPPVIPQTHPAPANLVDSFEVYANPGKRAARDAFSHTTRSSQLKKARPHQDAGPSNPPAQTTTNPIAQVPQMSAIQAGTSNPTSKFPAA